ncbi:MAG: hypothetical protein M1835_001631 [Candelina submexicana]|nr:MAG: hypothetical protein M1835_001631 [Candelina submexicana]
MANPPPLNGIRVLEFAGLAPGPFAGLLLADYGASVLRIDRPQASNPPAPTADLLIRHKTSVCIDLKSPRGISLLKDLIKHVDIIIDPFRPGVLEKLDLCPAGVLLPLNPRLIVARLTGFRREGQYAQMAGHDINYLAVSGVLSMLGRAHEKPYAPGNIVGDFAGGGAMCFMGIMLALFARTRDGKGQVVEANMVDGSAYLATMPRLATKTPAWNRPRGENLLDGGCPFYDTYETSDGGFVAVGALEPRFFAVLLRGLTIDVSALPGPRQDPSTWPALHQLFMRRFKSKTRKEWADIFDGTDACVTPVLSHAELENAGLDQRPAVTLTSTPGLAIPGGSAGARDLDEGQGSSVEGEGWQGVALAPGTGGENTLKRWIGWRKGRDYKIENGGLVKNNQSKL